MNQELDFFRQIFDAELEIISPATLCFQLLLVFILTLIISFFYTRFGNSLSNRVALSKTFILIGVTTMLIITIVKSSLALSLGLVGALSIVRFRTAIKEPEELAYFFIVISIGLGIGAEQFMVTIIGTLGICAIIFIMNRKKTQAVSQNLIIKVRPSSESSTSTLLAILEKHCTQLAIRRLDESADGTEISFDANFSDVQQLLAAKDALKTKYPEASFSFLQNV